MTEIILCAYDQMLRAVRLPRIASGNQNTVYLKIRFTQEWHGFNKSAVFILPDNTSYEKILDDEDQCTIPYEVLVNSGHFDIGIRGVTGTEVKTTTLFRCNVERGSACGSTTGQEPTPDIYQQILAKLKIIEETSGVVVKQSDWDQTDNLEIDFIKNKPDIATDEEIISLLTQEDMLPAVVDYDGSILVDENGNILLW